MADSSFFGATGTTASTQNTIQTSVDAAAASATAASSAQTATEAARDLTLGYKNAAATSETNAAASAVTANQNAANTTAVANIASDVTAVAGIASAVSTTAEISSAISSVAADATDIGAVAAKATEIGLLGTSDAVSDMDTLGTSSNVSNMSTLAGISSDITTTAGISSDITTTAGISSAISSVAADATDIGAVAAKATEIGLLGTSDAVSDMNTLGTSDVVADMNTLGTSTNVTNMNTLAGISSDITTTAGISSAVSSVAADATDIGAVAGKETEIGLLGTSANITAMGLLGTSANVTAMSNVSGSIDNVNTAATNLTSINDFASKYRIGASDPSSDNDEGDLFYNTTSDTLKVYTGSAWEQGVTAGSGFLPLSGGALTGNLTFSGSQTVDGRDLSVDGAKLDGIESGATADQTASEIKTAYESNSDTNAFTDADHSKLDGIEASATADQTASEIRALVESATDSNVFTDSDHSKLNGIEASADVTDTANVVAALTAGTNVTIAANGTISATDTNTTYSVGDGGLTTNDFTNADHSKLNGIEAGATADQTASEILTAIKTVDGASSGLDADLLDGQHGSHYLDANNFTNMPSSELSGDSSPQLAGTLDTNGQAIQFGASKWTILLDGTDLEFRYNGTTVFKLASNGAVTSANDITAFGSP